MTEMNDNNSAPQANKASVAIHPNQNAVAVALELDVEALGSVELVVGAIESKFGAAAEEQAARWFVMSVLRHLRKAKWTDPNESGLNDTKQMNLAKDCLAIEGFSVSLRTVTKDARSKFRMVGFASTKKLERGVLARSTKAYKIASYVILEAGLVEQQAEKKTTAKKKKKSQRPELEEIEKTVVGRRAKRRGYFEDEFMNVADTAEVIADKKQAVSMSEEEFANLDVALSKKNSEMIQQNWSDQRDEERWSRLLGLLAGLGFFAFVALLFL